MTIQNGDKGRIRKVRKGGGENRVGVHDMCVEALESTS